MSLYRRGKASEARRLFNAAASRIRPLPDDEQNPLASGASGDDMITWLAYREAAGMLGVEGSNPQSVTAWVEGLQREVTANPADTIRSLHLAMAFWWLGKTAEHEALCRQLLA